MLGRIAALLAIICLTIIYINDDGSAVEPELYSAKNSPEFVAESANANKNEHSITNISPSVQLEASFSEVKHDAELGVFACIPEIFFDEDARIENINLYFRSLGETFSDESSLYYALYAKPPEGRNRSDLLFAYHRQFPNNSLVAMELIAQCTNASDKRCTRTMVNDAIASDSNNGAIWLNAILFYAAKHDDIDITDAIYAMEKTALFNERFGEKIRLYAQALEGSLASGFTPNALNGLAIAASQFPDYSAILKWCKQGLEEPYKVNACLTLGEQLTTRSKIRRSHMFGVALQNIAFEAQGNAAAMELIAEKTKARAVSQENNSYDKAEFMLMLDERLMRSWLTNLDVYGEQESHRLLVEEAEALYEENENQLCTLIYQLLDRF
jgi:hypothetical protein